MPPIPWRWPGTRAQFDVGAVADLLAASHADRASSERAHLLAPTDLSAHKAAGVTFVKSMLERVVEEATRGDPDAAVAARARIEGLIGEDLAPDRAGH